MIRDALAAAVSAVLAELRSTGQVPDGEYGEASIDEPKNPEHGDYATNAAMVWSKVAGKNPRELGERVAAGLARQPGIASAEVAGPGFVNIHLDPTWVTGFVEPALGLEHDPCPTKADERLGINMEFVSVNPNGPITIGSGRGAAYGSTLANVLEAVGHTIHREYYINDGVNSEQMRLFAESVRAILLGQPTPDNGYKGDYVRDVASSIQLETKPDPAGLSTEWFQSRSQDLMLQAQGSDLEAFGVTFDTWFSEQSLHDSGAVQRAIDSLESHGVADREPYRTKLTLAKGGVVEEVVRESQVADEDDSPPLVPQEDLHPQTPSSSPLRGDKEVESGKTLWLRSTLFGDDMDRVLQRRDGRLTYIASDVAYHEDKFSRPPNADKLITVLGPDHHGYIVRLQAVVAANLLSKSKVSHASNPTELADWELALYGSQERRDQCRAALAEAQKRLEVLIFQLVRFMKDGKPAPMRKRDGNIYALIDLMREIGQKVKPEAHEAEQLEAGKDVARFFYLMRHHDTTFDFDLDLAEKQSDDNPVFYVQYAHARICSVLEKAKEAGFESTSGSVVLDHVREISLIKKIADLPVEVRRCAEDYGVHRLTTYAIELARSFHHFYDACRVIQPDQPELTRARLRLCEAARSALRGALGLLGVSTPEKMERAA
ncbi:MAG: Arginine--tRNA ligase [Fimbriimonadaceae bacterium]|nr:Arginine--tRNA ligase [Fimbriimonadaceae bacterium]